MNPHLTGSEMAALSSVLSPPLCAEPMERTVSVSPMPQGSGQSLPSVTTTSAARLVAILCLLIHALCPASIPTLAQSSELGRYIVQYIVYRFSGNLIHGTCTSAHPLQALHCYLDLFRILIIIMEYLHVTTFPQSRLHSVLETFERSTKNCERPWLLMALNAAGAAQPIKAARVKDTFKISSGPKASSRLDVLLILGHLYL